MSQDQFQSNTNYDLRNRDQINRPSRYDEVETPTATSLQAAKRRRAGKKSSLTKRIKQINDMIETKGSRTKLLSLQIRLKCILKEAYMCHEQFMLFINENDDDYNDDYIEELSMEVDTCISNIDEYLVSRADDAPSQAASELIYRQQYDIDRLTCSTNPVHERVRSWCTDHAQADFTSSSIADVTARLQDLKFEDINTAKNAPNAVVGKSSHPETSVHTMGLLEAATNDMNYNQFVTDEYPTVCSKSVEAISSTVTTDSRLSYLAPIFKQGITVIPGQVLGSSTILTSEASETCRQYTPAEVMKKQTSATRKKVAEIDGAKLAYSDQEIITRATREKLHSQKEAESLPSSRLLCMNSESQMSHLTSSNPKIDTTSYTTNGNVQLVQATNAMSSFNNEGAYNDLYTQSRQPIIVSPQSQENQQLSTFCTATLSAHAVQSHQLMNHANAGTLHHDVRYSAGNDRQVTSLISHPNPICATMNDRQVSYNLPLSVPMQIHSVNHTSHPKGNVNIAERDEFRNGSYNQFETTQSQLPLKAMQADTISRERVPHDYVIPELHVQNAPRDYIVNSEAVQSPDLMNLNNHVVNAENHHHDVRYSDGNNRQAASRISHPNHICATANDRQVSHNFPLSVPMPKYSVNQTSHLRGNVNIAERDEFRDRSYNQFEKTQSQLPLKAMQAVTVRREHAPHDYVIPELHVQNAPRDYIVNSELNAQTRSNSHDHHNVFPTNQSNMIDRWIDELPNVEAVHTNLSNDNCSANELTHRWIVNQNLPRIDIPKFEGDPINWVDFIVHFKEMVHSQPYLSTAQRITYLQQHLKGEAARCVRGFGTDWESYRKALQRLKFMFGQRASVAHAYLSKVTKGKPIKDEDTDSLAEFYYTISDCLSTLQRLGYYSDLSSSDVLRQAVYRLPFRLKNKWCEKSYSIRSKEEPNLCHLEEWLKNRIMASRDPYMPKEYKKAVDKPRIATYSTETHSMISRSDEINPKENMNVNDHQKIGTYRTSELSATNYDVSNNANTCILCNENHRIFKCNMYKQKDASERYKLVIKHKLCINCLHPNHLSKECKSKFYCFEDNCNKSHHTTLHHYFCKSEKGTKISTNKTEVEAAEKIDIHKTTKRDSNNVYLKIVPVKVSSDTGEPVYTYAFLDDGSEATLIRADLAEALHLSGQRKSVQISTITEEGEEIQTSKVSFRLSGVQSDANEFSIKNAYVLPKNKFNVKSQHLPYRFETNHNYRHLHGLDLRNVSSDDIQLLIGMDNYETLMISEIRQPTENGYPLAAKTPLGWTIFGCDQGHTETESPQVFHIRTSETDSLEEAVQQFWSTESFGTLFDATKSYSIQDKNIESMWDATTQLKDGHYIVKMPWKDSLRILPDNLELASKRFHSLSNRLKRQPELHEMYCKNINEYLLKGYARKMSTEEAIARSGATWYLPHHPVINVNKPGKVRVVFDAAAKYKNKSLNDHLNTGPDLVNNLMGVLLRFRNFPIAFVADIEAMFNQVHTTQADSDALRFLWKEDINDPSPPCTYQMKTHIFGAKSSPSCSSYALRRAAKDNESRFCVESIQTVLRDFYVDDLLKSTLSEDEALSIISDVIAILKEGGFNLTKFICNSKEVMRDIPSMQLAHDMEYFELDDQPLERTLGVRWNIKKDTFTFMSSHKERPSTKRGILQVVSAVFDPLGFLAPFLVRAKILLQNLWRKKCGWDAEVDDEDKRGWMKWLSELQSIPSFDIPRCYLLCVNDSKRKDLHVFADASELAFGAVAYIRVEYADGKVSCCMLLSKSRLAPIKTLTVPRLELQAAVLAVRIKNAIVNEIDITLDEIQFWSDSTITLQYINNEKSRFKVFVANRVAEIREHTYTNQWSHIPGEDNPADDMTRGLSVQEIGINSRWINGPDFLVKGKGCWPSQPVLGPVRDDDSEIKVVANIKLSNSPEEFTRCSSWSKSVSAIGWILRFISNCKGKDKLYSQFLSLKELSNARIALFRHIQMTSFPDELKQLTMGKPVDASSPLLSLNPYIDVSDALLRVGGRLRKANIPYAAKHQLILPSKSHLVEILVKDEHRKNIDCGQQLLLSRLQQNFWIIGARRLIKRIIQNCLECKKRSCKPVIPLMADLPEFRIAMQSPVFFNCGVDFFGPINTKLGRRIQKRWGCIFTCLVTRAIHLEVAEFLTTDAFINVLKRFVNRRGKPKQMVSDCGTNFKGANNELVASLKELNQDSIASFTAHQSIEWKFNPPSSPHMGGVWERMVYSVKVPLNNILKDRTLSDLQLYTVFTEVESLVNSRPLTPVSDDVNDYEALTPNHFLIGRESQNLPFGAVYDTDNCSRKRWKEIQFITSHFWKRWKAEYLPSLSTRPKWTSETRNMEIGDLVMVIEDNSPRGLWKLARVTNIFPGDDKRVRVAEVKTSTGTYTRPVAKLCLLEEAGMQQQSQ